MATLSLETPHYRLGLGWDNAIESGNRNDLNVNELIELLNDNSNSPSNAAAARQQNHFDWDESYVPFTPTYEGSGGLSGLDVYSPEEYRVQGLSRNGFFSRRIFDGQEDDDMIPQRYFDFVQAQECELLQKRLPQQLKRPASEHGASQILLNEQRHDSPSAPAATPRVRKRSLKKRRTSSNLSRKSSQSVDLSPDPVTGSIGLNPRDFGLVCKALGAKLISQGGRSSVVIAEDHAPFFPPFKKKLTSVGHERTYIMDGKVVDVRKRRCHDIFHDLEVGPHGEKAIWCDYGNAHHVLDTADEVSFSGKHNPRTIQLTRALAKSGNSTCGILPSDKPIVKCFYYVLKYRKSDKSHVSLGLKKHIYMLCDQSVNSRHDEHSESKVWLVRYFVNKDELHPSLESLISGE